MKLYIRSARYMQYDNKMIRLNPGETHAQAAARYRAEMAQNAADAEAANRIAREERIRKIQEAKKIPKYKEHDIVLGKDGNYYAVYFPYYSKEHDMVYYDAVRCDETGKWLTDLDEYEYSDFVTEIGQDEIKKKIKSAK